MTPKTNDYPKLHKVQRPIDSHFHSFKVKFRQNEWRQLRVKHVPQPAPLTFPGFMFWLQSAVCTAQRFKAPLVQLDWPKDQSRTNTPTGIIRHQHLPLQYCYLLSLVQKQAVNSIKAQTVYYIMNYRRKVILLLSHHLLHIIFLLMRFLFLDFFPPTIGAKNTVNVQRQSRALSIRRRFIYK